jgi:hypothetical protein
MMGRLSTAHVAGWLGKLARFTMEQDFTSWFGPSIRRTS